MARPILIASIVLLASLAGAQKTQQATAKGWIGIAENEAPAGKGWEFFLRGSPPVELLIVDSSYVFWVDLRKCSVARVKSELPRKRPNFEVQSLELEEMKNAQMVITRIPSTRKYAGGMTWLGWQVWIREGKNRRTYQLHLFDETEEEQPIVCASSPPPARPSSARQTP